MSSTTEKIKERLSIVDVLSGYITIEKAGGSLKARCPFHNEKTPSFFISPERNTYYCFGCGAKGDIFSFVQQFENLDFLGALRLLADKAGVQIESIQKDPAASQKMRLFDCIEEACTFFQAELKKESHALLYLKKRGLAIEMVRTWRIGFAPDDYHSLQHHLISRGFSEREIEDSGLIKQGEKGGKYARFRSRIMFPIFDGSGRVVAFSGRILKAESEEAKYINSPETPIFEKSKVLFGYHMAKREMRERGFAILVEGQMDLLLSHQAGFANTLASSGTAFTRQQAEIIKRLTDTLLIAYDSDKAGQNAAFRAWRLALSAGLNVSVVKLPEGLDPADAILKDKDLWQKAIESAKNIIEYYAELLTGEDKKRNDEILKEKILPLIASVESSIDQARFIQVVSQRTGLPESALRTELSKLPKLDLEDTQIVKSESKDTKTYGMERKTVSLLWYLGQKNPEEGKRFEEKLLEILPKLDIKSFEDNKDMMLFEAEMYYANSPNFKSVVDDTLYQTEEEVLKKDFAESMEKLKRAEAAKDLQGIGRETKECHEISTKLSALKSKFK